MRVKKRVGWVCPGGSKQAIKGHEHLEKIPRLSLKKHEKPICPWGEEQGRHKFKPYRYSYHFMYMPNLFSISVTRVLWGLQVTGSWVTGCSGRFWRAVGWVYVRMWSVVSYVDTLYARSKLSRAEKGFQNFGSLVDFDGQIAVRIPYLVSMTLWIGSKAIDSRMISHIKPNFYFIDFYLLKRNHSLTF